MSTPVPDQCRHCGAEIALLSLGRSFEWYHVGEFPRRQCIGQTGPPFQLAEPKEVSPM